MADFQLVILGGGPAGLTAGLYASRARLDCVLLEKGMPGGQVMVTDWIDNYPGFPEGLSGFDLCEKMTAQAKRFGLEIRSGVEVTAIDLESDPRRLTLADGSEITCDALIIAPGARPNTLGVPGEKELTGRGVSFCATCDGPFFRDQEIAVVGGGNTAVQEAVYLTKFASKVHLIHRRDELRATKIVQDMALANEKINVVWDTVVTEVKGGDSGVTGVRLKNVKSGEESDLAVQGVFVLIGTIPNNEMLPECLNVVDGFVDTDCEMRTNIPGVMAAGDIRNKEVRQVINGAGEGAVAAMAAEHYLSRKAK